jgi:hypothetical protein
MLLLIVFVSTGSADGAESQSTQFSFSDCNDIISETKLSEIFEHKIQFGAPDPVTNTFKRNTQPSELSEPLKVSTDAKFGCAMCYFSAHKKGESNTTLAYTGTLEVCTSSTQNKFTSFTSDNTANLKKFNQTVLEESSEIGKATVVNQMQVGNASKVLSVKFLDDEIDAFVNVSVQELNSSLNHSKPPKDSKPQMDILPKIKAIAKEVEQNIK